MIALTNNFTKPEQATPLLRIGIPAESADFYYGVDGKIHYIDGSFPFSLLWEVGCVPCWSVGRLQEISKTCSWSEQYYVSVVDTVCFADSIIDRWVQHFTSVDRSMYDFSKLED